VSRYSRILAVLPLAGGRFLRPTKEGGGRRESSPRAGSSSAVGGNAPPSPPTCRSEVLPPQAEGEIRYVAGEFACRGARKRRQLA
jgi:hypothetical protein